VNISFELPNDDLDLEEMDEKLGEKQDEDDEEPNNNEGDEGEKEEKKKDDMDKSVYLQIEIETNSGGQSQKIFAEGAVSKDQNIYIENIRFGENDRRLWFNDLSEPLQERFFDWMDQIGLDAGTGMFILNYNLDFKSKSAINSLVKLKDFLSFSSSEATSTSKPSQKKK